MKKFLLLFLSIFIISCSSSSQDSTQDLNTNPPTSIEQNLTQVDTRVVDVYFSKTDGAYYDGGVDRLIIQDINNSKSSLYMAMYDLTNKDIVQALIDAKDRGVELKVVTDNDTIDEEGYQDLIAAGVDVQTDTNRYALMHNKFLVIDKNTTWSGSGNYTVYAFYRNYENFIRIEDSQVALFYIKDFNKIYNHTSEVITYKEFGDLEVYFSPDSDFEEKIIELINNSQSSIKFLAFAFTNDKIADALIAAKNRGVEIQGVFDEEQDEFQDGSDYDRLLNEGIDVKLDGSSYKLHDKVFIFDKKIVITGSYNFTVQANEENFENSIVIYNADIAAKYLSNFTTIYQEAY